MKLEERPEERHLVVVWGGVGVSEAGPQMPRCVGEIVVGGLSSRGRGLSLGGGS